MTALWAPGTNYVTGDLVLPRTAPPVTQTGLNNGDFELGNVGWTLGAHWSITSGGSYDGLWKAVRANPAGATLLTNDAEAPVAVGQSITVRAVMQISGGNLKARIGLEWRDGAHAPISRSFGNMQRSGPLAWRQLEHTALAPIGAEFVVFVIEGEGTGDASEILRVDAASWNYAYVTIPNALMYEAAAPSPNGTSGPNEPAWPTVVGGSVLDGNVTWTAISASRVTWKAMPILKSGPIEPVWPTVPGALVADGTISWVTTPRVIEDPRCPHSKQVTITASKVWAGDGDIVRFCAINNARDWTTPDDAGYLPTGLHMNGNNECTALSVYRGNLAVASASTFQLWSVDEDPAANAMLDSMEGIGTIFQLAFTPVTGELFMLSPLGVRSVGIAVATNNLANGDIGAPIDSLIQDAVKNRLNWYPQGMYFPSAGQYWLSIAGLCYVYTINRTQTIGAWSRYNFPFTITGHAQLGDEMYVRDGDNVYLLTVDANYDEARDGELPDYKKIYYDGTIQWPWLDFGQPGLDKMMEGLDIIGTGKPTIQIGYDQRDETVFTDEYTVEPDTLTGDMIPMPVTAPTFSVRVIYKGEINNFWQLNAVNVHLVNA